jgi:acetylglutamate kinase
MKTAILKLSGKAIEDFIKSPQWLDVIKNLQDNFDGLVIVHGAGNQITQWSEAFDYKSAFIKGQRVTDENIMNVVAAVQSGLINGKMVSHLCSKGFNAVGLTGIDNNLFIADYADNDLGFVGIPKLNKNLSWLKELVKSSVIPVFSSICRDKDGNLMNVNADVFTNILAASLKAEVVFFISDVNGVILHGKIQNQIDEKQIASGIKKNEITGGMIPKLQSCISLLHSGIKRIWIGNNLSNSFSLNLKNNKEGTWIVAAK